MHPVQPMCCSLSPRGDQVCVFTSFPLVSSVVFTSSPLVASVVSHLPRSFRVYFPPRPFLMSQDEADRAPPTFDYRKAKGGAEVSGLEFRIQVSPYDCTGCTVCVNTCPDDALKMVPLATVHEKEGVNWEWAMALPDRSERCELKTHTRNEWRRCETTLETSGEDVKLHSKRVEKI